MLQFFRRRWLLLTVSTIVIAALVTVTIFYAKRNSRIAHEEAELPVKPEAPADLAKLRDRFRSGVEALQRNDGADAVHHFASFTFGKRAVEEYRLYYLANGFQLSGNTDAARRMLASLWRREPRLVYANDVAFNLANLYDAAGDPADAAQVYAALARRTETPAVAAAARWNAARTRLASGDVSGALYSARSIVIHNPKSAEADDAVALVRALSGIDEKSALPLTPSERLDRAIALIANEDPQNAFEELTALQSVAPALRHSIEVQRGVALSALGRYEDSNKVLEPLTSGPFKYAIPALRTTARNYAVLAASINPIVIKNVKEKKKVGTVKVRVGKGKKRHTVTKPKYQTVTKQVKLIDLAKKKKKDEYERLASERLKDLLLLPLDAGMRLETLNGLLARAESKNQDAFMQQLVPEIIKLDPSADPALQRFWDKGWAAYARGDLNAARDLFRFIFSTYTNPNVQRQSEYWYARTIERQGKKEEAMSIYRRLASAPYADLYAEHSIKRGAKRAENRTNPLKKPGPDWRDIAEKQMPKELELAYELTALSAMHDAYLEVRRNMRRENVRFAEALMADVYNAAGNPVLMYRSLRRAWPQLATAEQDSVPTYFLRMYYPLKYGETIEENAKKNSLDPDLVRALILQESYYVPTVQSRVGATGLMQLMPSTAKDHAGRLHIPFAASRLDNPEVNIRLGTFHLRMLMNMFSNNAYLAVASYNAGQGNVLKWRRAAPGKPMDEFLESIPFPETRTYVKRVTMLKSSYERMTL